MFQSKNCRWKDAFKKRIPCVNTFNLKNKTKQKILSAEPLLALIGIKSQWKSELLQIANAQKWLIFSKTRKADGSIRACNCSRCSVMSSKKTRCMFAESTCDKPAEAWQQWGSDARDVIDKQCKYEPLCFELLAQGYWGTYCKFQWWESDLIGCFWWRSTGYSKKKTDRKKITL